LKTQGRDVSARGWRYRIFAVTWLAYAGFYLCRKNLSVAVPLLETHLGYSTSQLANVIFGFSLIYALGQFVFGVLSDRLGPRLIVGAGLFLVVLSNLLLGVQSSLVLLTILVCLGSIGQATGWSGLVKTMACWFKREERGVVMGWWGTNYVLGGFLATVFATFVSTSPILFPSWSWRRVFVFPALLLLAPALIFAFGVRNEPADVGLPAVEDGQDFSPHATMDSGAALSRPQSSESVIRDLMANPAIWAISLMYFFLTITRYSFLFWLPLYMTQHLGYALGNAGYTSSLYELVGFAGAIIAGYASEKLFQSRRFPVGVLMLIGLAVASLFQPSLAARGHTYNALGISVIGIMTYGVDTLMSGAAAQDMGSANAAATASGFIDGVGHLGEIISPFLVAFVTSRFGWDVLFYIFVAFALMGTFFLVPYWNYIPHSGS
jgi:sugar phosphate permease